MTYNVVELFDSIEGEGKRAGQSATFIRLAGCNLRCSYCDTTYALENDYSVMPLQAIMASAKASDLGRITLTGGEPLTAPKVEVLIHQLLTQGYEANIETNGSIDITFLLDYMQSMKYDPKVGLFFTMDYKLPSSGETEKMHLPNYDILRPWDVLKFVVGSDDDATHMVEFLKKVNTKAQVYVGAVYGAYDLKKLVSLLLETPILRNAKLQLQYHKIIWDANERGV